MTQVLCILPAFAVAGCSLIFSGSDSELDGVDDAGTNTVLCEPWERSFAGLGLGSDRLVDVAVDGACGTVLCGTINGTYQPTDGAPVAGDEGQAFVARVDAKGVLMWAKLFGGSEDFDQCKAVALGPGSAGLEDVFVLAEVRSPGSIDDQAFIDAPGNLGAEVLVARLAGDSGKAQWVRGVGSAGSDTAHDIVVTSDRVYFSGFIRKTPLYLDGEVLISSEATLTVVVALDHNGEALKSRVVSDDFIQDTDSKLKVLESGDLLITLNKDQSHQLDDCEMSWKSGTFTAILRLDTDLNCLWSNTITTGQGEAKDVAAANIAVAGEVATIVGTGDAVEYLFTGADIKDWTSTTTTTSDMWIARLHLAEGVALRLDILGWNQDETAHDVALDSEGRAHMLGGFEIETLLADITLAGNGSQSSFVAAFDDDNTLLHAYLLGEPEQVRTTYSMTIIDGWSWFAGTIVGEAGNKDGFVRVQRLPL